MDSLLAIAQRVGIPALFALVLLGLGARYLPRFLDAWLAATAERQRGDDERRKTAAAQTDRIIEVAAQTELALRQSAEVIARNNEVVGAVTGTFGALTGAVEKLAQGLREHDLRAQDMNVGIHQILENARK
jgi:hypothetical protein